MLTQAVNLPESRRAHSASTFDNFLLTRVEQVQREYPSMLRGRRIASIQRTTISRFSSHHGLFSRRQGKGEQPQPRVMNAVRVAIAYLGNTSRN